jgi:hypothetical protein
MFLRVSTHVGQVSLGLGSGTPSQSARASPSFMPARALIFVSADYGKWGAYCGHCETFWQADERDEAVASALAHVAELPMGEVIEVVVQIDVGRFRPEWTYGQDPFPRVG